MSNQIEEQGKTKVDWSTPYDEWLIPLLNRARRAGAIEFRSLPSVVQLQIDKHIEDLVSKQKENWEKEAEIRGASKATTAINGELGLVLTDNGHYYIERWNRLHKPHLSSNKPNQDKERI